MTPPTLILGIDPGACGGAALVLVDGDRSSVGRVVGWGAWTTLRRTAGPVLRYRCHAGALELPTMAAVGATLRSRFLDPERAGQTHRLRPSLVVVEGLYAQGARADGSLSLQSVIALAEATGQLLAGLGDVEQLYRPAAATWRPMAGIPRRMRRDRAEARAVELARDRFLWSQPLEGVTAAERGAVSEAVLIAYAGARHLGLRR